MRFSQLFLVGKSLRLRRSQGRVGNEITVPCSSAHAQKRMNRGMASAVVVRKPVLAIEFGLHGCGSAMRLPLKLSGMLLVQPAHVGDEAPIELDRFCREGRLLARPIVPIGGV